MRALKYLEIFYLIFLVVVAGALALGYPHLQSLCIILFALGFCLAFFGFAYFLAKAMLNALSLISSNNEGSASVGVNTGKILQYSADYFVDKMTNGGYFPKNAISRRYAYYLIIGISLLILGLILTFIFDYLNLI